MSDQQKPTAQIVDLASRRRIPRLQEELAHCAKKSPEPGTPEDLWDQLLFAQTDSESRHIIEAFVDRYPD